MCVQHHSVFCTSLCSTTSGRPENLTAALRACILLDTFLASKYHSVKYTYGPDMRLNRTSHRTTPRYSNLSEICTNLFRVYVIAKSSAFNSQSSLTLRDKIFSSAFSEPTLFFPKMQILSSEIWGPTHISTENSHLPNF